MPASDDQQMEIDMIQAMFDTAFTLVSEEPPQFTVDIANTPDDAPELVVRVEYPVGYPDEVPPIINVECVAVSRRININKVQEEVRNLAEENVGMHSVTGVLQHVQAFLCQYLEDEEKALQVKRGKDLEDKHKSTVKVDPTIRMGNSVTPELFMEWQKKHLAAKAIRKAAELKRLNKTNPNLGKLTGRQLWDRSLNEADWDLFAGQEEGDMDLDAAGFEFVLGSDEEGGDDDNEKYDENGDGEAASS